MALKRLKWRKTDWRPITRKSGMGALCRSYIEDKIYRFNEKKQRWEESYR
jgi:hypothetical protein